MNCALAILLPIFSVGTMHRAPTLYFIYFLGCNHNISWVYSCYRDQTTGKVDRRYCLNNQALWYFTGGLFYFEKQDFPKSKNRDRDPFFLTSFGAESYNLHRAGIVRVVVAAYPHHIISIE